jgi:hypothetical protein
MRVLITGMSRLTVLRAHASMLCDCCVGVMRGAKWLVRHKMVTPAWEEGHACDFTTRRVCQRHAIERGIPTASRRGTGKPSRLAGCWRGLAA